MIGLLDLLSTDAIQKHQMTMIKLYQAFCPDSTDRVVRMVSKLEKVMACLENVFELLENQAIKGARKDYNPDNFDESNAPNYGGYMSKDGRFHARVAGGGMVGAAGGIVNANQLTRRTVTDNTYDSGDFLSRPSVFSRVNTNRYEESLNVVRSMFNQRNPNAGYANN